MSGKRNHVSEEEIGYMKALINKKITAKQIFDAMIDEGYQIGFSTVHRWVIRIKTGVIKK